MTDKSLRSLLRRAALLRNNEGVAAIEFALLLPLLFLLLSGSVELQEALTVHRKLAQIAATVADLVARDSSLTSDEMSGILTGSTTILLPYKVDGLKILVVVTDTTPMADTVAWSAASTGSAPSTGSASPIPVPKGIREQGTQTVAVQVNYSLTSTFAVLFNAFAMEATHFAWPR